jgi:hypothetical protein
MIARVRFLKSVLINKYAKDTIQNSQLDHGSLVLLYSGECPKYEKW